jgi:NAD(P)-dependent dehydrogenase (short-subunit alcohol dehydrogenase family)
VKLHDFSDKAVLVTGGTRGIGLATALAFAKLGAHCYVTYRWGGAEDEVLAMFAKAGAPTPELVQADASKDDETRGVFEEIKKKHEHLFALVSNVASAQLVRTMDDYDRRGLLKSIEGTAWPIVSHVDAARKVMGRLPSYIVAVSSAGHETYHPNYDFAGASKAVLEVLCRYLAERVRGQARLNVIQPYLVPTDSLRATLGEGVVDFVSRYDPAQLTSPDVIANVVVGLCSGLFDGLHGQVIRTDVGARFSGSVEGLRHHVRSSEA